MTYPEEWDGPHELPQEMASRADPDPDPGPDPDGPWDDCVGELPDLDAHTAAAVAMTECTHAEDTEGLAALLRHMDAPELRSVCVTFAKLLAEGCHPELITSGHLRWWAAEAVRRQ